ncbi:hypothetical protein [Vibrio phage Va2]|nr:hypothetical protein [Vibrio phage Va2]
MATPKNWNREGTKEDNGFIHSGSIDRFRASTYAQTALESDTLETESYWQFSMFHGPSHAKALNQEHHRPNIRTNLSVGVTNYMTQSRDLNKRKAAQQSTMFMEVISRICDHDLCTKNVMTILGYMIVQNEVTDYLPSEFELEFPEVMEAVEHFEEHAKGSENTDNWTGKVKLRVPKYIVQRYLKMKKSEFYKLSATLKSICEELFGSAEGILE